MTKSIRNNKSPTGKASSLADAILQKLEGIKGPKADGNYSATCPFCKHRDDLSFHPEKGWKCFVGCGQGSVRSLAERLNIPVGPLTLEQLAGAKGLPVEWLKKVTRQGKDGVEIPYSDQDGRPVATRIRLNLEDTETAKRFAWRSGDKTILYGLWGLDAQLTTKGYTILVEGESDCWTLWYQGFPAQGVPGAANWKPEWAKYLKDFPKIYAWQEPEKGGQTFIGKLAKDLPNLLVISAPPEAKDPSALYLSDPQGFKAKFMALLETARLASEVLREMSDKEWQANYELAKLLLEDPLLLVKVVQAVESQFVVGERRNVALLYQAIVSRYLSRPLNVEVFGPFTGGKTHITNAVVAIHAPEAVYTLTSGSERSFVYSEDDFSHRFIYFQEAKGVHSGDVAQAIIHELAWGNRLRYGFVDKTAQGLKHRLIEKLGPTGLILTTTKPLEPELESRFLLITVKDTPQQNLEVIHSVASRKDGSEPANCDLARFHALSRALARPCRVQILYGHWLADRVPHTAVRIRRSFELFLSLVEASAILHQYNRPKSADGGVVATVTDYAIALTLAGESLLAPERGGLTALQLEAVEAVKSICKDKAAKGEIEPTASQSEVAKRLGISGEAARQRLLKPLKGASVRNLESRKGYSAKYVPGDDIPEVQGLPSPEALVEAFPNLADDFKPIVNFLGGQADAYPPENSLDALKDYLGPYQGTLKSPNLDSALRVDGIPKPSSHQGTLKVPSLDGSPLSGPDMQKGNHQAIKVGLNDVMAPSQSQDEKEKAPVPAWASEDWGEV